VASRRAEGIQLTHFREGSGRKTEEQLFSCSSLASPFFSAVRSAASQSGETFWSNSTTTPVGAGAA